MHTVHLVRSRQQRGAALVIVLAFVVLLTALVVASLSRTQADRTLSYRSFNQSKVDQLAESAAEIVIGDLRQEIVNGSNAPVTVNEKRIYTPSAAANMLPQRSGNPLPVSGVDPVPNLVRRSVSDDPIAAPGVSSRASAVNSTTDASHNRRAVSLARWNNHYLLPLHDPSSGNIDSTPLSPVAAPNGPGDSTGFTPPDWVILTRSGPSEFSAWNSDLSDATKDNYAIGRYAYAVYDEGGLLDVNVAGYPTPASPSTSYSKYIGLKGVLAFADLTVVPGAPSTTLPSTQVNNIVGWRNFATTQQPTSNPFPGNFAFTALTADLYANYVVRNTNGFMKTSSAVWTKSGSNPNPRTDQTIISRQQLLDLRRSVGFSQNTLQYLGTFSREVNSPSFSPDVPSAPNPSFNSIRASATTFPRFDDTPSVEGEPLVKTRFPLSRLAWLTYKGPSAEVYAVNSNDAAITQLTTAGVTTAVIQSGTADKIKKCFGLVWDARAYVAATATAPSIGQQWVYVSPSSANGGGTFISNFTAKTGSGNPASDIKSLATVASENREPDFFELLRATILDTSIGQNTGDGVTGTLAGGATIFPDIHMSNKAHHILSIAAAVVDQADPDSYPTRIQFKPTTTWWTAYGVESLPYITQLYPATGTSPTNNTQWATYLLFQLWNPCQNPTATAPSVRLRLDGSIGIFTGGNGQTYNSATDPLVSTGGASTIVKTPTGFATPAALTPTNATAGGAFEAIPAISGAYLAYRLPDYSLKAGAPNVPHVMLAFGANTAQRFNATMEVDMGGGVYVPYNHFIGINDPTSWIDRAEVDVRAATLASGAPRAWSAVQMTQSPPSCFMKADPRSTRFGIFQMDSNPTGNPRITQSLWPSGAATATTTSGYGGLIYPTNASGIVQHVPLKFDSATLPYFPATLCRNTGASTSTMTSYTDPDGILRPADAAYPDPGVSTPGSSTPYYTTSKTYWPIILNRPFRSVAELGYAFRDLPWRSVDLFSDRSADAGLLDVFSVVDEPAVVAGHVNLNTRQTPPLQAILAGTNWDELTSTNTYSKTTSTSAPDSAQTIAPLVIGAMATTPAGNRSELISRAGLPNQLLPVYTGSTAGRTNQLVKSQREAVPRALASVTQTRTWNLMIDVIAQSGKYPPGTTDLAKFVVEGEQRYWVHVAIDRFTGEVIDRQVEAVKE